VRREWEYTTRSLAAAKALKDGPESAGSPDLMFALAGVEAGLMNIQEQIIGLREQMRGEAPAGVQSNVDWWSWYAYQRHGAETQYFDEYYARRNQLGELEGYITRINDYLGERLGGGPELAALPETMIPSSSPGGKPYFAPPMPLWKPPTPPPADTGAVSPPEPSPTTEPGTMAPEKPEGESVNPAPSEAPADEGGAVKPPETAPAGDVQKPNAEEDAKTQQQPSGGDAKP
jgi:hypothetical protein